MQFGQAWPVALPDGSLVSLQPWRYGQHIAALRQCVQADAGQIALDADAFADCVLADSKIDPALFPQLRRHALWWAAGGVEGAEGDGADYEAADDEGRAGMDNAGWQALGGCRARLQPWRERERMAALLACLNAPDDASQRFDVAGYLDCMVRQSVLQLEPPLALETLDSRATRRLLAAVVACNVAEPVLDPQLATREAALRVLRICQGLGWTPSQVWAAPAAEIDRLLVLLDQVNQANPANPANQPGAKPAQAARPSMADRPDAIVIMIDQEEPQHV